VRGQTLGGRQNRGVVRQSLRRVARHLLVRGPTNEIERTESRVAARQTAGRENVIAAGYVVAEDDRRLFAEEDGAGVADAG